MKQIGVAIVGTGWCGGIRAETLAGHPLVRDLHLAEINPVRLQEMSLKTKARTATADYRELLSKDIQAVYISATPESLHFPMARDFLAAGKHVFLEKPIAVELAEADELISLSTTKKLKFTIGYSQRFNPKHAYVRKCIREGTIGKPVSALVSRHITRCSARRSPGAARPRRWSQRTTSTSCSGASSLRSRCACTRSRTSARCRKRAATRSPTRNG
jgi:predicted dehydrogenase